MKRISDTKLENRHHVIVAQSGTGKSTWLKKHAELKKAKRKIYWDPDDEHEGEKITSLTALIDRLRAAGNGPVCLSVSVLLTRAMFERFLEIIRVFASADRVTYVICEEMSTVVRSSWDAPAWIWFWTGSRKYGIRAWGITHSPRKVDLLPFRQAAFKWFGGIDQADDRKCIADNAGVPIADLEQCRVSDERGGPVSTYLYGSKRTGFKLQKLRLKH